MNGRNIRNINKGKMRVRIPPKLKAELQKEINSECPFCSNNDVGIFEVHHIDGNPSNNIHTNLLLLCQNCHSKITKGYISLEQVLEIKSRLIAGIKKKVEFVSVNIDSTNCSWTPYPEIENAFKDEISPKSPFPILDFNFINHSDKTIMLKTIRIRVKELYSGLSGLPPEPSMVKSLTKYFIPLKNDDNIFRVFDSIQVPAHTGFRFQTELYEEHYISKKPTEIDGRKVLYFSFEFSDNIVVNPPSIYLNCIDENDGIQLLILE